MERGCDLSMKKKRILTIELIPETVWYHNLRSMLDKEDWDLLRRWAYRKAEYKCEICGGRGDKWPVEAHEVWQYNDRSKTIKLVDIIALCPMCHKVKHIGLAQLNGEYDIAIKHLAEVNKWSIEEAERYLAKQVEIWEERSRYFWEIDISFANDLLDKIKKGERNDVF